MAADPRPRGCIITFYSYKGGTGRTMALANVACLLADAGDDVLVVDWDLEAPGLHRFFPPRLRAATAATDLGLDDGPGVIDLFATLREGLPATTPASEEDADAAVERAFTGVDLDGYVRETAVPHVRIMRAGRNDDGGYSRRVGTFDWEGLFQRAPGIYREFADRLTAKYRWVLVDSRTGVTDISGICTYLLPERLVVVFTPNRQSLTGVRELVQRATEYRRSSDDLRPLLVYPLPSRIEASLQDLRARWRFGDVDREVIGYQPMFQDLLAKSYGLPQCDLSAYFDDMQIQQTPDYAYGEEIAVRRTGDRFSMANSYVVFTNHLKTGEPPWRQEQPPRAVPDPALTAGPAATPSVTPAPSLTSRPQPAPAPSPRPSPPRSSSSAQAETPQIFLSYATPDRDRVMDIASALADRNFRVHLDKAITPGSDYSSAVSQQLDASDAVVVFWSRDSAESAWVRAEAEEGLRRGILIPVLLDDVSPPLGFRSVQAADLRRSTPEALEKLADAIARIAAGTPGTIAAPTSYAMPTAAPVALRRRRVLASAVALASVVVLLAGGYALSRYQSASTNPDEQIQRPDQTASDTPTTPVPTIDTPTTGVAPTRSPSQMVTVPNFVGASSVDVVKAAELIGLTVSMTDGRGTKATYLEGVITRQSPAAGTAVQRSSQMELVVAGRTVAVPTLVGNTLNTALSALERNGLRLGKTESQAVADAKPGTIVRQSPEAGVMTAAGAAVDVVVADALRIVPDVLGRDVQEAREILERAGLRLGAVTSRESSGPPDRVIAQSLPSRARVRSGELVDLAISTPATVQRSPTSPGASRPSVVPDVLGKGIREAFQMLDRAGLARGNVTIRPSSGPPDRVLDQSPSSGTLVPRGSPVHLVVAAPGTVQRPPTSPEK